LLDRFRRRIGRHLFSSADDAPPERIALEMHPALEARREQPATVDLPAAIGPVMR